MIEGGILDSHVHLFNLDRVDYPWLKDNHSLGWNHLPEDYSAATYGLPIESIVVVEAAPADGVQEAAWVSEAATTDKRIKGMVAHADVEVGAGIEEHLKKLKQYPIVKGVRRLVKYEQDAEFCLKADFVEAVRLLPQFGYCFDICISYPQTENAIRFVEKCPDVRMVLDHMGTPLIKDAIILPWKEMMRRLAEHPNVSCKVSSILTETNWRRYSVEEVRPFVGHLLEVFGPERCMWGGDWPVSAEAAPYHEHIRAVDAIAEGLTKTDRRKLFHDTAVEFYGLEA